MRSRFIAVAVLMYSSSSAFAQESSLMIPNDREASAQVASIVASAREAGLPTNPIVGKVNYGVNAMRSKPNDIVRAASIVKTRLETARTALAPNPTEQEITQGADALGASATIETLRELRRAGRNRSVAAALGLLTQLLSSQVPLPRATAMATELLQREATPTQIVALGNDIASDMLVGVRIDASMDVRMHHLIATLAAQRGTAAAAAQGDALAATGNPRSTSGTPPPPPPRRP
jgi:hypothetical protein